MLRSACLAALLATLVLPTLCLAQSIYGGRYDSKPSSGSSYDPQTRNQYNWNRDSLGNTTVRGHNYNTGSNWNTNIQNNGNMRGHDAGGNSWQYNNSTGSYYNFGTGKTCFGKGASRTCN